LAVLRSHTERRPWSRLLNASGISLMYVSSWLEICFTPTMDGPDPGDLVIRQWDHGRYELLDGATRECIASLESLNDALSFAAKRKGAVWRELLDNRGRPLGPPTLVLPRVR